MNNYSQPDFYKLNEDSIKLVKFVKELEDISFDNVLDACCGCGVIGIELSNLAEVGHVDFLDIQADYKEHLQINIERLFKGSSFSINIDNLLNHDKLYDLILLNPPYYNLDKFRPSPDDKRNIARSFKGNELVNLINKACELRSESGVLVVVLKASLLKEIDEVISKKSALVETRDDLSFIIFS